MKHDEFRDLTWENGDLTWENGDLTWENGDLTWETGDLITGEHVQEGKLVDLLSRTEPWMCVY